MGITKKESARWQKIASIPEKRFEEIVRGEKPTETKVAKAAPSKRPTITLPADWVNDAPRCTRAMFMRICKELVAVDEPPDLPGDRGQVVPLRRSGRGEAHRDNRGGP
jgi:hypothetical protein